MNSITASNQTVIVPFYGQELFLVNYDGEPYTPMKPIVENMGMDWKSQFTKLKQRFSSTVVEITIVAKDGKERLMTCLPIRKLAGWLYSISPNKVKPELREKVVTYQEECDDVLWRYWTNSQRTDAKQREALVTACDKLAIGNTLRSDVYTMVANHFGYEKVTQIPAPLLPEAVAFAYEMILARQKPSQIVSEGMLMNNRMWRDVGFIKTEQVCLKTQELSTLLTKVDEKVSEIKRAHVIVFDSFSEQKWNGLTPEQLELVDKQGKLFL